MPQNQGQFGNLFPLLAKLQERSLPGILVQQIGNVLQRAAVVVRNHGLNGIILRMGGGGEGIHIVVCAGHAVIVLLLGNIGGGGGGLGVLVVRGLLVKPGRVGLGVLVVAVDMGILHHLGWLCVVKGWVKDVGNCLGIIRMEDLGSGADVGCWLSFARNLTMGQRQAGRHERGVVGRVEGFDYGCIRAAVSTASFRLAGSVVVK